MLRVINFTYVCMYVNWFSNGARMCFELFSSDINQRLCSKCSVLDSRWREKAQGNWLTQILLVNDRWIQTGGCVTELMVLWHVWTHSGKRTVTHAGSISLTARVISCICDFVFVSLRSKKKWLEQLTATKVSKYIVNGRPWACVNPEVKSTC